MKGSIMYWVKQHLIQPEPIPLFGPFTTITIPPESKELFKKHFPCSFLEQTALSVYSLQHFNSLLPFPGKFVPTSIKTTVIKKPEEFLLETKLSHLLVRSGTIWHILLYSGKYKAAVESRFCSCPACLDWSLWTCTLLSQKAFDSFHPRKCSLKKKKI